MDLWIWVGIIVILIFALIFIIALILPDDVLGQSSIGSVLKTIKDCCKRKFKQKSDDDPYDFI